jgi:hypothetical protein
VSADPFADVGGLPMSQAEMEATEGKLLGWLILVFLPKAWAVTKVASVVLSLAASVGFFVVECSN